MKINIEREIKEKELRDILNKENNENTPHRDHSNKHDAHGSLDHDSTKEVVRTRKNSIISEKSMSIFELLVQGLFNHKASATATSQVTRAIRTLSIDQKAIQQRFSDEGIVQSSLKMLKVHKNNELICENIGWMLSVFTVSATGNNGNVSVVPTAPNLIDGMESISLSPPVARDKSVISAAKNNEIARDLVYKDAGNWALLVSCIEIHITKGASCQWLVAAQAAL